MRPEQREQNADFAICSKRVPPCNYFYAPQRRSSSNSKNWKYKLFWVLKMQNRSKTKTSLDVSNKCHSVTSIIYQGQTVGPTYS